MITIKLCMHKRGGGGEAQIGITFVLTYTDEEALILDDQDGQREVLMEAVEELVEMEGSTEVAEAERLAEAEGLAEVEGLVEVEGFAEVEGLAEVEELAEEGLAEERLTKVEAELQDNRNGLLADIIDRLSSVASQLRVPQDSEMLFSLVSSGT